MQKIVADCFNCEWMLFLGNTEEGICVCLAHRIQIEPNPGLHCTKWRKGGNFRDCIHADDAMVRAEQKNDQYLPDKE